MKRKLVITLGVLLALLLVIFGGVYAVLSTESGNRWALSKVPGLTFEGFEGKLLGNWKADKIIWQQDGTEVQVLDAQMRLSTQCLWQKRVCIDYLKAKQVAVTVPEDTKEKTERTESIELPNVQLPVEIQVAQLELGSFVLNGQPTLSQVDTQLAWLNSGLTIDHLTLNYTDISVKANGHIQPTETDWPTQLHVEAIVPIPEQTEPLHAKLTASGSLTELNLAGTTSGYIDSQLDGSVNALAPELPLTAKLKVNNFLATPEMPTLTVSQLTLDAQGDLKQGFNIQSEGQLKGDTHPVHLKLKAFADLTHAKISELSLFAENPEHALNAIGDIDWQQALKANVDIDWTQFPWQQLLPGEPLPVSLEKMTATFSLNDQNYLGKLDARLLGPEGEFTLTTPIEGDFESIKLNELKLIAGQGQIDGNVAVGFKDEINWLANLKLSQLNPAYWVKELPGTLNGELSSDGVLLGENLTAKANLQLRGDLRHQATQLLIDAQANNQAYDLKQLQFAMGKNHIDAKGTLHNELLNGDFKLNLTNLAQLWPNLAGQITGQGVVKGKLSEPELTAEINGQKIAYETNRIQQLNLKAKLSANQQLDLATEANNIELGETDLGNLNLTAKGQLEKHQLAVDLKGPTVNTSLTLEGGLKQNNWNGQLQRMFVESQGQRWELQQAMGIHYLASGKLSLDQHCWTSKGASLCAEKQQQIMPEPKLDYRLNNFSLTTLQPFLPENISIEGMVNGQLQLDIPAAGPKGNIVLDASNGRAKIQEKDQWQEFVWKNLILKSHLTPDNIVSQIDFTGDKTGVLQAELSLNPQPENKPIKGNFVLSEVDLSVFKPFVPQVETLQGIIAGKGNISGTLAEPIIDGLINLNNGHLAGGEMPMELKDLGVQAKISGTQVDLSGGWKSGEKGQGTIGGNIKWEPELDVNILLKGNNLPVTVEPYADIIVEPDLKIILANNRLQVAGVVSVPRGSIEVPQLPASATRISSDARIVGEKESEPGMQIAMNVTVEVGEERLKFNGFGLTADIKGHLKLGDNMASHGQLALENGRYNAYGQKLEIRKAQLLFEGPISEPFLDIEAVRVTGDVTAGLRLSGSATAPTSEIFSDPAMSQEQALSWLLLGRPLEGGGDGNAMAQAALVLGLMGSTPVVNKLAESVGLQEFSLDSEGSGDDTSLKATGKINDKLSMSYGVGVFDPSSVLSLRYELTKRLYIEAASGVANSIDLFYKKSF